MEALGAVLRKGSSSAAARSEEDLFYEDIEAPKFVDFTVPDHSRPDDRSWFCARVGCDENHEDVDPEAIYKSFVLRVMAARSPNVRLQKALNGQRAPSAIAKCPRSAPAKPVNGRATRSSALGSISQKMGTPSKFFKVHPISTLRSTTPNHGKAVKRPPTTEKAMTTPRNRSRPPKEEPFRSAKSCKARPPAPKGKTVVKALNFQTPKKGEHFAALARRTPIQELSAGMKKIHLGSKPRATEIAGSNAHPTKPSGKVRATPVDLDAYRDQIGTTDSETCTLEVRREKEGEEREPFSSVTLGDQSGLESSSRHKEKDPDPQVKRAASDSCSHLGEENDEKQTRVTSFSCDFDEDKENAVQTYSTNRNMDPGAVHNGMENFQNKIPIKPLKAIVVPSKATTQDPNSQGIAKYKPLKPTNPRPFRLRTDERGILREANLERGRSQKEAPDIKIQERGILREANLERGRSQKEAPDIKIQGRTKLDPIKPGRSDEAKTVPSIQTKPMEDCKEKSTRKKTQNKKAKLVAVPRQLLKPQSVAESESASLATLRSNGENCANMTNTFSPQIKRAITIPREPVFHKIHMPKGCTKRLEKAN